MPQNLPLTVGMQLRLPVINPNGSLSMSNAPAMIAQGFGGGFNGGSGLPRPAARFPAWYAARQLAPRLRFKVACPRVPSSVSKAACRKVVSSVSRTEMAFAPQGNGFAPQGQGFAPQQGQPGMQQAALPQGNLPQGGQFGPQGQQFAPQGNMPQGQPLGAQGGMPQGPQAAAPQGPMNAPQAGGQFAPQARSKLRKLTRLARSSPRLVKSPAKRLPTRRLNGAPNGMVPRPLAAPAAATNGRPLPSIVIGSLMSIGGQQLGNDRGMVHLNVNGTDPDAGDRRVDRQQCEGQDSCRPARPASKLSWRSSVPMAASSRRIRFSSPPVSSWPVTERRLISSPIPPSPRPPVPPSGTGGFFFWRRHTAKSRRLVRSASCQAYATIDVMRSVILRFLFAAVSPRPVDLGTFRAPRGCQGTKAHGAGEHRGRR